MIPIGTYPDSEIVNAWVEKGEYGLKMCFECEITCPDGTKLTPTARHDAEGKYGHIGKAVAESLDLEWPDGLRKLGTTAGRKVTIKVKHKEVKGVMYDNAYIMTKSDPQPATEAEIEAGIAIIKATVDGDEIPF